jgi:hypothetical protein
VYRLQLRQVCPKLELQQKPQLLQACLLVLLWRDAFAWRLQRLR